MTFHICLDSMADLYSYIELLEKFAFSAYIKGKHFVLEAHDILELFSFCPQVDLQLILMKYEATDVEAIKEYLQSSNLLIVD